MSEICEFEVELLVKEFKTAIGNARSVIDRRNVIDDLTKVKLSISKEGKLQIVSSDIDLYFKQEIGCNPKIYDTEILLPSEVTFNIAKNSEDTKITLRKMKNTDTVEIIGASSRFALDATNATKYVSFEDINNSQVNINLPAKIFTKIVSYCLHAVSREESRYTLNGIYLHIKNNKLCAAATDSHRLVHVEVDDLNIDAKDFSVIVPRKAAEEISKLLKDKKFHDFDLQIVMSENKIKFVCADVIFISKIIDGTYPDYKNFIPKTSENKMEINGTVFRSAIERIKSVTTDKFPAIKMLVQNNSLQLSATGHAIGKSEEIIKGIGPDDQKYHFMSNLSIEVGFNPGYLIDTLDAMGEGNIEMFFQDKNSPVLIKLLPDDNNDNMKLDASFVVMPFSV